MPEDGSCGCLFKLEDHICTNSIQRIAYISVPNGSQLRQLIIVTRCVGVFINYGSGMRGQKIKVGDGIAGPINRLRSSLRQH